MDVSTECCAQHLEACFFISMAIVPACYCSSDMKCVELRTSIIYCCMALQGPPCPDTVSHCCAQ